MTSWLRALAGPAVHEVQANASAFAERTALMIVGGVAFLVASAFVLAALYTLIRVNYGSIAAQLSLAGVFAVVGTVFVVIANRRARDRRVEAAYRTYAAEAEPAGFPTIATAFAMGFARGLRRREH